MPCFYANNIFCKRVIEIEGLQDASASDHRVRISRFLTIRLLDDRTLSRREVPEKLYRIGNTVGGLKLTIPPLSYSPAGFTPRSMAAGRALVQRPQTSQQKSIEHPIGVLEPSQEISRAVAHTFVNERGPLQSRWPVQGL
jgi:hypothetical protein